MSLLARILRLSPIRFENLIYDLLVRRGLLNPTWRTPGADRGRDIEGQSSTIDFSGQVRLERWYIECKRHERAVDWPTVAEKLAYATNHQADYLLICTTSTLSPQCKDEVAVRERRRDRPLLRIWEGPDLETLIAHDSVLCSKYELTDAETNATYRSADVLWLASKAAQAAYGAACVAGAANSEIEQAAALSELASAALAPTRKGINHSFRVDRDSYPWCTIQNEKDLTAWDPATLRAILTTVRMMTRAENLQVESREEFRLAIYPAPGEVTPALRDALNAIAVMSDLEWSLERGALAFTRRPHG